MLAVLLAVLSFIGQSANIYCSDSLCTSCIQGILYNKTSCLSLCPSLYSKSEFSISCIPEGNLNLFDMFFYNFTFFSSFQIGPFYPFHLLSFEDGISDGPIPTKERGFYFSENSALVSDRNYMPAPDFTMRIAFLVKNPGTVFRVTKKGLDFVKIEAGDTNLQLSCYLTSQTANQTKILTYPSDKNTWEYFTIYFSQGGDEITIGSHKQTSTTFKNFEFRPQDDGIQFIIGDYGLSFSGFIYRFAVDNSYFPYSFWFYFQPILCDIGKYFDVNSEICNQCLSTQWPLCTRSENNYCFTKTCIECGGFGYKDCIMCNGPSGICLKGKNCISATGNFQCTECSNVLAPRDGLCLENFYNPKNIPVSEEIISIKFTSFDMLYGGVFQSGNSVLSYGPFENPEDDDPYPAYGRGLYFTGTSYLLSSAFLVLNYKNTLSFWIKPENSQILFSKTTYKIYSTGLVSITLSNEEDSFSHYSYCETSEPPNEWTFLAVSLNFISETTILTLTINSKSSTTLSIPGMVFYDNKNTFAWIGSNTEGSGNFYQGFLYTFSLWQSYITDFSYKLNILQDIKSLSIQNCDIDFYYNDYYKKCMSCDDLCNKGCRTWNSCNLCSKLNCFNCLSFDEKCSNVANNNCYDGVYDEDKLTCCYENCLLCFGSKEYECLKCKEGFVMIETLCVENCPIGYFEYMGVCEKILDIAFHVVFNRILGNITDNISMIEISQMNLSSKPLLYKSRGFYFTDSSYLTLSSFTLPLNFTIVFWIKQFSPGILFSKTPLKINTSSSISISPTFTVDSLQLFSSWTLYHIAISYNLKGTLSISQVLLNENLLSTLTYNNYIYQDTFSQATIGSETKSFIGFLWLIQIFSYVYNDNLYSIPICNNILGSDCLWDCNKDEFFNGNQCEKCNKKCNKGCVRNQDCGLCQDPLCEICDSFFSECLKCLENYELRNGICIVCNFDEYYDNITMKCSKCKSPCKTCLNYNICHECITNSTLMSNGICECDKGYYTEKCLRKYFNGDLTLSSNNTIMLIFNESLYKPLDYSDIKLTVNNEKIIFNLTAVSSSSYKITIDFLAEDPYNKFQILFLNTINSTLNSLLLPEVLKLTLFPQTSDLDAAAKDILKIKEFAIAFAQSTMATAFGCSAIFGDLNMFFSFLNSLEIYSYIGLYNIEYDKEVSDFLGSLMISSQLPNVFEKIIDKKYGVELDKKYVNFGYEKNLFIVNSGSGLLVFIILFGSFILVSIAVRLPLFCLKGIFRDIKQKFQYKIFLRFLIQFSLEFTMTSLLSLAYCDLNDSMQIVDLLLSCFVIAIEIYGLILFIYLINKRAKLTNEEEIKIFLLKYGTIFEEFTYNDCTCYFFYIIFIIRRFALVITILFISSKTFQITISMCFTLLIPFYLIITHAYKIYLTNIFTILNEFLIFVYYFAVSLSSTLGTRNDKSLNSAVAIQIIIASIALNLLYNIAMTIRNFIALICDKKKNNKQENNFSKENDGKFEKTEKKMDLIEEDLDNK
ncbi:hypothetical protein SteCoe_1949 [Stentor coeruleus]|uniref:TNFR-Cys domain-containing protein n=1 Tax=Stentor coeruleus TaxID=5963 RepID=A0A1R2D0M5_9CILI|nr:hypothetical protein SteCoe_1949 [Stentor coeruleus]